VEIKSWEVYTPKEGYSASDAFQSVQINVVSHALPHVESLEVAIKGTATIRTVNGTTQQELILSSSDAELNVSHDILYEAPRSIVLGIPGIEKYEKFEIKDVALLTANFPDGAVCRDGKLSEQADMTLPAPFSIIKPMLVDLLCLFDPSLPSARKVSDEQRIRARLPRNKQTSALPIELWAVLENPSTRPTIAPAITAALKRCPGVAQLKDLLAPKYWTAWPCPKCIEACTATSTEEAIESEADPAEVVQFARCIAHCTTNCDATTLAEISSLSKSDRIHNYPPKREVGTTAVSGAAAKAGPKKFMGVDLNKAASVALNGFHAKSNSSIAAECDLAGYTCFDLETTGATRVPNGVTGIRVVVKDDTIVKLAMKLQSTDDAEWPTEGEGLLGDFTKILGPPTEIHPEHDTEATESMFSAEGSPLPDVVVGIWNTKLGRFEGNVLQYNPAHGEGRAAEVVFHRAGN